MDIETIKLEDGNQIPICISIGSYNNENKLIIEKLEDNLCNDFFNYLLDNSNLKT